MRARLPGSGPEASSADAPGIRDPTPSWRTLAPAARTFVMLVTAGGGVAIAAALPHVTTLDGELVAIVLGLSLVASVAKVAIPVPGSVSTITLCYVVDYASLLLLGRHGAVLTAAFGAWTQCVIRSRRPNPVHQTLFSISSLALTLHASGLVYEGLEGPTTVRGSFAGVEALLAAATVFFVINSALVAGAIALSTRRSIAAVWGRHFVWSWPPYVIGAGIAAALAAGVERSYWWLLPLIALPLALTYANLKSHMERLAESLTDPLTTLPNRRFLLSHVEHELARARQAGRPMALIIIDLDRLKHLNDTFGHHVGDVALCRVAWCIERAIRANDVCARYGGDEFVVVLPGCGRKQAARLACDVQNAVAALAVEPAPGTRVPLGISIGAAIFPEDGQSFDELLPTADARMFGNKGERRREFLEPVRGV